ncbi:MAG: DMT family transporter [Puniceicoccales bacterium]|jgi:drug/metabolite transporter (DMT)-like permease|nr:DMT family transporter [Puniceicoccales bacterium]
MSANTTGAPRIATGIVMIVCTVMCFACMDSMAKHLGKTHSPLQIAALRYIGSVIVTLLLLRPWRAPRRMRTGRPVLQIVRSACLALSTVFAYISLGFLPLTELTTIYFASPLVVSLLAGPFLGEKTGPRRIAAVIVGFIGVLIVLRPSSSAVNAITLVPLVGAVLNALYNIATRKLAGEDAPETTMFYTGMVGMALLLPVLPFVWTAPAAALDWALLGALGTVGALAHWLLILAHKNAPASMLAPFCYTQLLGALVISDLFFDEVPDAWTLAGSAIIISSGLYVFYREAVRRRERNERISLNP